MRVKVEKIFLLSAPLATTGTTTLKRGQLSHLRKWDEQRLISFRALLMYFLRRPHYPRFDVFVPVRFWDSPINVYLLLNLHILIIHVVRHHCLGAVRG